jgi:hypothetical protein
LFQCAFPEEDRHGVTAKGGDIALPHNLRATNGIKMFSYVIFFPAISYMSISPVSSAAGNLSALAAIVMGQI